MRLWLSREFTEGAPLGWPRAHRYPKGNRDLVWGIGNKPSPVLPCPLTAPATQRGPDLKKWKKNLKGFCNWRNKATKGEKWDGKARIKVGDVQFHVKYLMPTKKIPHLRCEGKRFTTEKAPSWDRMTTPLEHQQTSKPCSYGTPIYP